MKLLSKLLILLLLAPVATVTANDNFKGKYTKEKTLKKEYDVSRDANVTISNSYGNIDIVTWNENRVVIDVVIRTNGDDEEKVQARLDDITVDFSGNSSQVTAETRFGSKKSSWSWWKKKRHNISMEINYTVKMPVTNSVDLGNDYGNISLNKLEGKVNINCDYGQLILGELMADDNNLNFDYTKNSTISYMKSGEIVADYSGFSLDKAESIILNADYTQSEIGEVNELEYNNDYGKLSVGKVNKVVGRGSYLPNMFGTVTERLDLNTDYGTVVVDRIDSSAKQILVNSDYTGVKLAYDSNLSFDFIIKVNYSGVKGLDDLNVNLTEKDRNEKYYEGYHNRAESGTLIEIESSYGGVALKKI